MCDTPQKISAFFVAEFLVSWLVAVGLIVDYYLHI